MLYERDPSEFRDMTVTLASGESYRVRSDMVFQDGQLLGVQNTLGQPVVVEHQPGFALDVTGYQMMLLWRSTSLSPPSMTHWTWKRAAWPALPRAGDCLC